MAGPAKAGTQTAKPFASTPETFAVILPPQLGSNGSGSDPSRVYGTTKPKYASSRV